MVKQIVHSDETKRNQRRYAGHKLSRKIHLKPPSETDRKLSMALHFTTALASDVRCGDSLQNRQIGARRDNCCDQGQHDSSRHNQE